MTFTVVQRTLTRQNVEEYRSVFRKCFPGTKWKSSVPFPKDPVYAAFADGQVVGFCMVHSEPPQKMTHGPGGYMYNLCVDPAYRRHGAGSAILSTVARDYPQCYSHMEKSDDASNRSFMNKLGWKRVGAVRKYYEYALLTAKSDQPAIQTDFPVDPRQYDDHENVIYLDA